MSNFLIIAICLIGGWVIRQRGGFSRKDAKALNTTVLWLSLPALIFAEVPRIFREVSFSADTLWISAMPWIQFALAVGFALAMSRAFGWSKKVVGAIALTAGLGNTSFVGFPVVEAFFGIEGLRYALFADQLGSFLALSTVGLVVASACAGRTIEVSKLIRRVLTFPPFLAFCLSVVWGLSSLPTDGVLTEACRRLGMTVVPLALISVGWQLEFSRAALKTYGGPLAAGLIFKLLAFPLFFFCLLRFFVPPESLLYRVSIIEAAMGPMITAAVVAVDFELEPELAQLMVGVGIPVSLLSLPLWHFIVSF